MSRWEDLIFQHRVGKMPLRGEVAFRADPLQPAHWNRSSCSGSHRPPSPLWGSGPEPQTTSLSRNWRKLSVRERARYHTDLDLYSALPRVGHVLVGRQLTITKRGHYSYTGRNWGTGRLSTLPGSKQSASGGVKWRTRVLLTPKLSVAPSWENDSLPWSALATQ